MRSFALFTLLATASAQCSIVTCPFPTSGYCDGNVCVSLGAWLDLATSLGIGLTTFTDASLFSSLNASADATLIGDGALVRVAAQGSATVNVQNAITLGANAAANAALSVEAGAMVAFGAVNATATKAYIAVQASAQASFSAVNVAANKALAIGLAASTSASAQATAVTFTTLELAASSSLTVSGSGSVTFPSSSAQVNVAGDATITASGGARLAGNLGSAALTIAATGTATATAYVNATLTTMGTVKGTGTLYVAATGNLVVESAATAWTAAVDVQASGRAQFKRRVQATGSLTVSGTVEIYGDGAAASASSFGAVAACNSGGTVTLALAGTLATAPASGTIFTYASLSGTAVPACTVQLKGTDGQVTVLTAARGSARRLLADGTANWGSNSLTYTNGGGSPAAPRAVFSLGIFVALVAVVFAFRQ